MGIAFCQFCYLTQPNTGSDVGQLSEWEQLTSLGGGEEVDGQEIGSAVS